MGGYIGAKHGTISATVANVPKVNAQDVTATDTTPEVTIINSTHEDTDGGREGKVIFKGQQSGGEETTLAEIQASHDGTADDEKGDLIFRTNDGSDGSSPTEAMRIDSLQNIITSKTVDINTASRTLPVLKFTHTNSGFDNFQIGGGTPGVSNAGFTIRDVDASANRFVIDGNGNTGIGISNGLEKFTVANTSSGIVGRFTNNTNQTLDLGVISGSGAAGGVYYNNANSGYHAFQVGGTERMRISGSNIGIGSSDPLRQLHISNSSGNSEIAFTAGTSGYSSLLFGDGLSGADVYRGYIQYHHSDNSMIFATNAAECFRITNLGKLLLGTSSSLGGFHNASTIQVTGPNQGISVTSSGAGSQSPVAVWQQNGSGYLQYFTAGGSNTKVGEIYTNGSSTTYGTSSDYRLKENVTDISDGITRVKQLAPKRFNFIADAETTVDGFLAHEAQAVVPEAITGTKDQVEVWADGDELPDGVSVGDNKLDDDGKTIPVMQGIDQSKIVPLLVAALQEAIAKIETLETKVAALEAE